MNARQDLYDYVRKNHGKMKTAAMVQDSGYTPGQIEAATTKLIAMGVISPKWQKVRKLVRGQTTRKGLTVGKKRHAFEVGEELVEQLKALAHYDRVRMKDIADDMVKGYVQSRATVLDAALELYHAGARRKEESQTGGDVAMAIESDRKEPSDLPSLFDEE